jgi:hypothetical protein
MNDQKRIPVTDKSSGKQRFTEPVRRQTPRESTMSVSVTSNAYATAEPQASSQAPTHPATQEGVQVGSQNNEESGPKAKTKIKQEIATIEQFIGYAYGRKGQPLSVKQRVLQDISTNTVISNEGLAALQRLAFADKQFCVPRQILLAIRDIDGYPAIKESLKTFVQNVMLWHPIFRNAKVNEAIRNLPEALTPAVALKLVMTEVIEKEEQDEKIRIDQKKRR